MNFININIIHAPRDRSNTIATIATIVARIRQHFNSDHVDRSDAIATIDTIATRTQCECGITLIVVVIVVVVVAIIIFAPAIVVDVVAHVTVISLYLGL